MTPCTGQPNFQPCLTCARQRPVAIMRPVEPLRHCAFYAAKRPVLGNLEKPPAPKLQPYAGAPR